MNRFCTGLAVAAVIGSWALLTPASAAPPTVTPSPGYDARLQEQRAARTYYEPAVRIARPGHRRHMRRTYRGAR